MIKYLLSYFFFITAVTATAQRHKIAVFAPLYLDSAFTYSGDYRFNKTFPKFLNQGIEFYQGVEAALDSLQKRGAPLEVFIYDTRSYRNPLAQQLRAPELRDVELMIGHTNATETRQLADAALAKKVPFVSATLPNDAGLTANPYLVILNTTLQGHIEGIYKMLQRNHSADNIVLFRKSGQQEEAIRSHFSELARVTTTAALKLKFVDASAGLTTALLQGQLDSNRRNVVISGSMEEAFGARLAATLAPLMKTYPTTLVGMPTWDNVSFNKAEYKGLDIIYTVPFYYNRQTPLESRVAAQFERAINSRPTDLYFRGYETVMRFALLLLDTKKDISSNLTRKGNAVFTRFDIQPVFKDKNNMTLDYFENKNLYFVRLNNGVKRLM